MISKYQEQDIPQIIDLGKKINPKFEQLFNINNLPANEQIYVYKEEQKVLGFLHILFNLDTSEILNLVVKEAKRKQGIATLLIDGFLSEPNLNYERIILEVRVSNIAAIKLYQKFNFAVINTREKYYGNEDAFIMERSNES